jgi:hypothetical protein
MDKIFCFGSNQRGIHGAGTAKIAAQQYGAQFRVGEGRTGNAYAIPTKITPYKVRRLIDIQASVDMFLEYARAHADLEFHVVRIGCGLAGFSDEQIAPLFADAPANCRFDPRWEKYGLSPWEEEPYDSR